MSLSQVVGYETQASYRGVKKRFLPVDIIPTGKGWGIRIAKEPGESKLLSKKADHRFKTPQGEYYEFKTQEDAWRFIHKIYRFCLKSEKENRYLLDQIIHCDDCKVLFKSFDSDYCGTCTDENGNALEQFSREKTALAGAKQGTKAQHALALHARVSGSLQRHRSPMALFED